jgi:hypothetical protein
MAVVRATREETAPRYTVVVQYPIRLWEDPTEGRVHVAFVHGYSLRQACMNATMEAVLAQKPEERGQVQEWKVLCAFGGHPNWENVQ